MIPSSIVFTVSVASFQVLLLCIIETFSLLQGLEVQLLKDTDMQMISQ